MAPELLDIGNEHGTVGGHSAASDIYALAMVIVEVCILTRSKPFHFVTFLGFLRENAV